MKNKILLDLIKTAEPLLMDQAKVVKRKSLTTEDLEALYQEKICGIHIPNFCDSKLAQSSARKILSLNSKLPSLHFYDVKYKVGLPKRLGMTNEENKKHYFRNSLKSTRTIRDVFGKYLSPVDKLRLELDELWKAGANVSRQNGGMDLPSIVRYMGQDTLMENLEDGFCHIDDNLRDNKKSVFSASIYLKMPKDGGTLQLWNVELSDKNRSSVLYKLCNSPDAGIQRLIRRKLGPPLKIKPLPGDLVIFDVGRPHAVSGFSRGERLSLQSFLEFYSDDLPIKITS